MHVMCIAPGGIFQAARINGVDCTFDPPRVYQIPEKEDTTPTEDIIAEFCVATAEVDDTATNNKKMQNQAKHLPV